MYIFYIVFPSQDLDMFAFCIAFPLQLAHPTFDLFCGIFNQLTEEPDSKDYGFLIELVSKASGYYRSKEERQKEMVSLLQGYPKMR